MKKIIMTEPVLVEEYFNSLQAFKLRNAADYLLMEEESLKEDLIFNQEMIEKGYITLEADGEGGDSTDSEKKEESNERCAKCVFANLDNDHGILYCAVTGGSVKSDDYCLTFKPIEHNPDKKEYIDPLVTKEEMASVVAEIKSESYPKISRLIQYLMEEYLVEDIQVERVFEAGEDFYRVKLKYKEFPF